MKAFALLAAALAIASPAFAGTPVTLKAQIVDADGVVTLGEIFDGAGAAAKTPVASRAGASVMLNAQAVRLAAARAGLDWANAEGLRQIVVTGGAQTASATAPKGNVDVLVWARSLAAGEIVQPQDLIWGKAALAPAGAPGDPDAVVGLAAKHALREGAAVAARDVSAPQVVKANDTVTLTFESEGVSLAMQAKAMAGGAVGETISVQNVTSKKIVQAVVTGPGQAAVGPAAEELKLNRSSRYALR
jgi:flagella basal body P-ring formation protein FlgA